MSYLLDKKLKRNKIFRYSIIVVVLFVLIYFRSSIFRGLSYVSSIVFHPVLILGNNIGEKLSGTGAYFYSKSSLFLENQNLKSELNTKEGEVANYNSVLDENLKMKEILGRKNTKASMVLASILSKPNQSPYDTLVIDIGINEGITAEQRVFALGNVPIGRIAETYPNSSKVILYSNPGEQTEVIVSINRAPLSDVSSSSPSNETSPSIQPTVGKDTFMQIVGRGGGNFEMILPRDAVIEKGAEAVLPGITPYTVGIVQTIISDPRDAFQKALLASPVNIQDLKFVEVEK